MFVVNLPIDGKFTVIVAMCGRRDNLMDGIVMPVAIVMASIDIPVNGFEGNY